jgi:hypothetical protein
MIYRETITYSNGICAVNINHAAAAARLAPAHLVILFYALHAVFCSCQQAG